MRSATARAVCIGPNPPRWPDTPETDILLDGEPHHILAGAIHYLADVASRLDDAATIALDHRRTRP